MSQPMAVLLGAIAGATIFLGLPVARIRGLPTAVQGVLNAFATGRPRKMVAPAMAPSRTAMGWLMIPLYG